MKGSAKVHQGMFECAMGCHGVQGSAKYCKVVSRSAKVTNSAKERQGVQLSAPECWRVFREY